MMRYVHAYNKVQRSSFVVQVYCKFSSNLLNNIKLDVF